MQRSRSTPPMKREGVRLNCGGGMSASLEWEGGTAAQKGTCEGDSGGPALDSQNRVIGTVSTEEKAKLAREAGADEVIRYDKEDFAKITRQVMFVGQGSHFEIRDLETWKSQLETLTSDDPDGGPDRDRLVRARFPERAFDKD